MGSSYQMQHTTFIFNSHNKFLSNKHLVCKAQQIPLVRTAIWPLTIYHTSEMTLHPGYFTYHSSLTNGTKQNQTLHPGWPYIQVPYEWEPELPISKGGNIFSLSGAQQEICLPEPTRARSPIQHSDIGPPPPSFFPGRRGRRRRRPAIYT